MTESVVQRREVNIDSHHGFPSGTAGGHRVGLAVARRGRFGGGESELTPSPREGGWLTPRLAESVL